MRVDESLLRLRVDLLVHLVVGLRRVAVMLVLRVVALVLIPRKLLLQSGRRLDHGTTPLPHLLTIFLMLLHPPSSLYPWILPRVLHTPILRLPPALLANKASSSSVAMAAARAAREDELMGNPPVLDATTVAVVVSEL